MSHDDISFPEPLPLPESIAGMCEFALHYSTNRPNFEASWRVLWTMLLSTYPEHPELAKGHHHQLFPTSEYPLSKRNAFRSPSPRLTRTDPEEGPESETDNEPTEDEREAEPVQGEAKPAQPPKIYSFRNPFLDSDRPDPYSHTNKWAKKAEEDLPLPHTPPPTEHQWDHNTPSVASTRPITRGTNARFYVDFAVLSITRNPNSNAGVKIFNRMIYPPTVNVPIALELKKSVKRSRTENSFAGGLSTQLSLGRVDIEDKVPVAFICHRTQESVIGISASALWWCFTIMYPGRLTQQKLNFLWSAPKCSGELGARYPSPILRSALEMWHMLWSSGRCGVIGGVALGKYC